MKTTVQFTEQEIATVIAALRHYQEQGLADNPSKRSDAIHAIAAGEADGKTPNFIASLDGKAVDDLCERINTAEPLRIVVEVSGGVVDPVHVSHEAVVTVYDHDNIEAGDEPPIDLEKESSELEHTY